MKKNGGTKSAKKPAKKKKAAKKKGTKKNNGQRKLDPYKSTSWQHGGINE